MEFKEQIDATVAKLREARMAGNKDVYHVDEVAEAKLRKILLDFGDAVYLEGHSNGSAFATPVKESVEPAKEAE